MIYTRGGKGIKTRKREKEKQKGKKKENLLRQFSLCHKLHDPRYHSSSLPSCLKSKNDRKGAGNTSATSLASSCGINDTSGSAFSPVIASYE